LKDSTEEYFNNIIMNMINKSNKELAQYYDCLSDGINNMIKQISSFEQDIAVKLVSEGWTGDIVAIGQGKAISILGNGLIKYIENQENKNQEMASLFITDEIGLYCYWSQIGGCLGVLNPIYEDFMIAQIPSKGDFMKFTVDNNINNNNSNTDDN
jgi:hypothetical protein